MASPKGESKTSLLPTATGSRLCWQVGMWLFVALMALNAAALLPTYVLHHREMISGLETRTRHLVGAAMDNRGSHDLFDMVQMGDNLMRSTAVRGGVILDGIGSELASFGAMPQLTWKAATLLDQPWVLYRSSGVFDIFMSPESMRLDHGLILSYDANEEAGIVYADLFRQAVTGTVLAAAIAVIAMLLVGRLVVKPVNAIRQSIELALHDPEEAIKRWVPRTVGHELGLLADAAGDLLFVMAASGDEHGGAGEAASDDLPIPAISVSEHGFITSANAAALDLFGVESDVEIAKVIDGGGLRVDGRATSFKALLAEGDFDGSCEIVTASERVPCLISCAGLERHDGTLRGYMMVLVDVSDLVADMRAETERRGEVEQRLRQSEHRIGEYRQLFEACIILLDKTSAESSGSPVTIMPEMLITSWLGEMMRKEGIGQNNLRHNSLPPLIGNTGQLRKIFQLALSAVWARSLQEDPVLFVQGAILDAENAQFAIREVRASDPKQILHASDSPEAPILIGALSRVAGQCRGGVLRSHGGAKSDLNELVIRLPLDAVTMRTIIEDQAPEDLPGIDRFRQADAA